MSADRFPVGAGERIIIVGGGQAGGDLAAALRMNRFAGSITIIGDEPQLPYSRPPLSKAFMLGKADPAELLLRSAALYEEQDVTVRTATRVSRIDRETRRIWISEDDSLPYDNLVLATGGRPRTLPAMEISSAPNCFTLRTLHDVERMRPLLREGSRLAVIGGGYIGLEFAAVARSLGMHVTLLEAGPRVLGRVTAPVVSEFFQRVHAEEGVDIRLNARIAGPGLREDGTISEIRLESGEAILTDIVLAGIGLIPNTELAEEAGLEVDNGIIVDDRLRTSDPRIFAIGDVARHPDAQHGGLRRIESVPNASEQARLLATVLTGADRSYDSIPWFWSDQYDVKLQAIGISVGYDNLVIRGDSIQGRSFAVFYLRGDVPIAADVLCSPRDFAMAKKLVAGGAAVEPARLADVSVPLKDIAAQLV